MSRNPRDEGWGWLHRQQEELEAAEDDAIITEALDHKEELRRERLGPEELYPDAPEFREEDD